MKKSIVTLTLALIFAGTVSAQNQWPDIGKYAQLVLAGNGITDNKWQTNPYLGDTDPKVTAQYAFVEKNPDFIDTPLEMAIYFYCYPKAGTIPPDAEAILPHSNPRLVDRQLGAAVYKELAVVRFLNTAAAVRKYETMLTFITGRGNATRAEIEAFYRQNVGALIAAEVDAQFNKVEFLLNNSTTNSVRGHNSVLTRDAKTGHYTLSYGGYYTNNETRVITANSLETLLAEMRKNKTDFDDTGIQALRAQAALIPAVQLGVTTLTNIKNRLTSFFQNPANPGVYDALTDICYIYSNAYLTNGSEVFGIIGDAYIDALVSLNRALASRIVNDAIKQNGLKVITRAQAAEMTTLAR